MRFCQWHQLTRTRRVLAEAQTAIEKAARRRQRRRHQFSETQLRIARESLERQESIKALQGRNETAA